MLHLNSMKTALKRPPPGPGYRPDFVWGDTVVEVKADPHSFRSLRDGLLQLAYYLADKPDRRGLLLLGNPRLTDLALKNEWRLAEQTLKKNVLERLSIVAKRGNFIFTVAGEIAPGLREQVDNMIAGEARIPEARSRAATEAVFLVLLLQWFRRNKVAMTTQYLMQAVGCSYPTVAGALRRLGSWVQRESDRRIKLWGFPAEEWQRVVAARERVHPTIRYVDRSDQRRSPEELLKRAAGLDMGELAVGGVIAARHYYPQLDLRGTPRLDLTLHCSNAKADLSFVERLDPALERTDSTNEPVALAVHVLGTRGNFFTPVGDGLPLADEVDCLLSLHDARLDAQAKEFLDHLVTSVG